MKVILILVVALIFVVDTTTEKVLSPIISGKEAKSGQFPYQAFLRLFQKRSDKPFECGGVVLSQWYIVTAAHCVDE